MAERRPLLKQQENEILELLLALGLDPREFEWDEAQTYKDGSGDIAPVLKHKKAGYWFMFGSGSSSYQGGRLSLWHPPDADNRTRSDGHFDWDTTKDFFMRWAELIKAELDAPDLWAELGAVKNLVVVASQEDNENRPFDQRELAELDRRLDELQRFIQEHHATTREAESAIAGPFRRLKAAAKRLGRLDWLQMFVGTLVGLVAQDVVTKAALYEIAARAHELLHPFFAAIRGWLSP